MVSEWKYGNDTSPTVIREKQQLNSLGVTTSRYDDTSIDGLQRFKKMRVTPEKPIEPAEARNAEGDKDRGIA